MNIRRINTASPRDRNIFINFPHHLYQNCKLWVPTLKSEMNFVMDRKRHPFFTHSEADYFIVEDANSVLGRIAVLHNRNYCTHHNTQTAFIYFFDSINNPQVSHLLLDAAKEWARERGLTTILGPRGFSRSSGIGMLVEGYNLMPAMGIAYNYEYYQNLIEREGFIKETDYLSGYLVKTQKLDDRIYTAAEKIKNQGNFWVKTFKNKDEMRQSIQYVNQVHNQAFSNNPGYYPSTPDEFKLIADTMIQIADPRLVKLIMKDDQIAGFLIAYKNICKGIHASGGSLFPFGWIPILIDQSSSRLVDINGLGLLPAYQGRGANLLLYTELEVTLREFNFEKAELVQVDERNFKSKSDMENMGVTWNKKHRVFRLDLNV